MKRFADFGSVIHGTLRPEDLIPAFADALRDYLRTCRPVPRYVRAKAFRALEWTKEDCRAEEAGRALVDLSDALDCFAPAYAYFGAHPGDGSDFGFWPIDDVPGAVDEDSGLVVADISEIPRGFSGPVLLVNDHGNMTLYAYSRGRGREVWAIV